jgi:hypothetical protein
MRCQYRGFKWRGLGIRGGLDRSGLRGENVCVGKAGVELQLETYLVDRILQSRHEVKIGSS